jgi:hypothetical protein
MTPRKSQVPAPRWMRIVLLPCQPRPAAADGLLEHRTGVDVGFLLAPEGLHHDAQFLEPGQDRVVVIRAQRVFAMR